MSTKLTEIQQANLRAWIADLRANPQLQGKNVMQTEDGKFCCLGRAEFLRGRNTENLIMPEFAIEFCNDYGFFPQQEFCIDGYACGLSGHNDGQWEDLNIRSKSFAQISDALEQFLLENSKEE